MAIAVIVTDVFGINVIVKRVEQKSGWQKMSLVKLRLPCKINKFRRVEWYSVEVVKLEIVNLKLKFINDKHKISIFLVTIYDDKTK